MKNSKFFRDFLLKMCVVSWCEYCDEQYRIQCSTTQPCIEPKIDESVSKWIYLAIYLSLHTNDMAHSLCTEHVKTCTIHFSFVSYSFVFDDVIITSLLFFFFRGKNDCIIQSINSFSIWCIHICTLHFCLLLLPNEISNVIRFWKFHEMHDK